MKTFNKRLIVCLVVGVVIAAVFVAFLILLNNDESNDSTADDDIEHCYCAYDFDDRWIVKEFENDTFRNDIIFTTQFDVYTAPVQYVRAGLTILEDESELDALSVHTAFWLVKQFGCEVCDIKWRIVNSGHVYPFGRNYHIRNSEWGSIIAYVLRNRYGDMLALPTIIATPLAEQRIRSSTSALANRFTPGTYRIVQIVIPLYFSEELQWQDYYSGRWFGGRYSLAGPYSGPYAVEQWSEAQQGGAPPEWTPLPHQVKVWAEFTVVDE